MVYVKVSDPVALVFGLYRTLAPPPMIETDPFDPFVVPGYVECIAFRIGVVREDVDRLCSCPPLTAFVGSFTASGSSLTAVTVIVDRGGVGSAGPVVGGRR